MTSILKSDTFRLAVQKAENETTPAASDTVPASAGGKFSDCISLIIRNITMFSGARRLDAMLPILNRIDTMSAPRKGTSNPVKDIIVIGANHTDIRAGDEVEDMLMRGTVQVYSGMIFPRQIYHVVLAVIVEYEPSEDRLSCKVYDIVEPLMTTDVPASDIARYFASDTEPETAEPAAVSAEEEGVQDA